MKARDKLVQLRTELLEIDKQVGSVIQRQMDKKQEIEQTIIDVLREEKTLQLTTWNIDGVYLHADDNVPLLVDVVLDQARDGWHMLSIHITDNITLRMDDERFWIRFDQLSSMQSFISEWGLTISSNEIDERLAALEKERQALLQFKADRGI
jgi:hypothetical protein